MSFGDVGISILPRTSQCETARQVAVGYSWERRCAYRLPSVDNMGWTKL